ncbi:hypothetical protein TBKG_02586 [Mycobacterium tuberculosis '98-R604 INH-RIF-EM']|nr:predicted protein [Mycobacterium tuberculosis T17]EPZ66983.1 hypothetical protein TBKG_02586 [Mycobacterium tuberculosis '98-R604 INH-RIF-EM']SIP67052.1 conserved hypothetical protein [Mycobacterium tuberculosis]
MARECVTEPAPRADSRRANRDQMWSEMDAIEVDEQVVTRAADLAHAWLRRGALRIGRATR